MSIQAIETRYKGYRFRSRLEARWAVFFDAMDIQYQYEFEGFKIDGHGYLPDFFLPDLDMWFEVKGKYPTSEEQIKASRMTTSLCEECNRPHKEIMMIAHGDPGEYFPLVFAFGKMVGRGMFIECPECGQIGMFSTSEFDYPEAPGLHWRLRCQHNNGETAPPMGYSDRMFDAIVAARSARFEHGETPKVPRGRPRK